VAKKLTSEERRDYGEQVIRLSSRSVSDTAIAENLGLNRRTVKRLREEYAAQMDPGAEVARAESIQHHLGVIAMCWKKIGKGDYINPFAMSGLLNTALSARKEIDKLQGVAPAEHVVHEHKTLADIAREAEGKTREQRLRVVDW
jgi:hypothetical protein